MDKRELIALAWATKNGLAIPKTAQCGRNGHYGTLARHLVVVEENREIVNVADEVRLPIRFYSTVNFEENTLL